MTRGAAGTAVERLLLALLPFLRVAAPVLANCPLRGTLEECLTGSVAGLGPAGAGRQPVPL
ncbi:hypothetical protein WCN79_17570 [Xanthomonas axonopodis pv. vasculorum]|uniref:hypothetical protein n=1 Tax=Xanthomonas axonopodis TaxID=53413 RepID=UPI00267B5884